MKISDTLPGFESWLVTEKRNAHRTVLQRTRNIQDLLNFLGDLEVSQVEITDLRRWVASLSRYGANTLRSMISSLRCYTHYLWVAQIDLRQQGLAIPLPVRRQTNQLWLPLPDLRRFVLTPSGTERFDAATALLGLGLRQGEVRGLQWRDVDFSSQTLIVRHAKHYRWRVLPLTPLLSERLERLTNRESYVIAGRWVDRPLCTRQFGRLFHEHCARAGLPADLTPHHIRHSVASNLVLRGASVTGIRDLLGHSTLYATNVYLHITTGAIGDSLKDLF